MRVCCRKALLNMGKSFIEINPQMCGFFSRTIYLVYVHVTEHCIICSVYATAIIFLVVLLNIIAEVKVFKCQPLP